ncbi:hypothetical protein EDWATA_00636 [Edwardsiella tarda ATCC 23685]|uniref:Uncharacterized protein n=1 Tax=Edwardsiella tarda ATCC 23685 TaxID=500638 RepID=D4F1P3_EDWTA|nr:hypothetical protein EDWATA_00636 [Edwardsiella tarda ATCC 23685]
MLLSSIKSTPTGKNDYRPTPRPRWKNAKQRDIQPCDSEWVA